MSVIKISLFQKNLAEGLSPGLLKRLSSLRTDFLLLPEFFYADKQTKSLSDLTSKKDFVTDWLCRQNRAYKRVTIGGSILRQENGQGRISCPILSEGNIVDWYDKQGLSKEEKKLAGPGESPSALILGGHRFAVLLGDEIYDAKLTRHLAEQAIRLVFCLTMVSATKSNQSEEAIKKDEDRLTQIASRHNFHIVRCSPVGSFLGRELRGRSLVVSPDGVSWRISMAEENQELLKTVVLNLKTL